MAEHYDALLDHVREITNLIATRNLLSWDQSTKMPPAAGNVRAGQMATLSRVIHETFTSEATLLLLDAAANEVADADFDSDEASMIRVLRRDYEEATRLPAAFVAEQAALHAQGREVWVKARAENDFALFQPILERIIATKREEAALRRGDDGGELYDALLGQFDRDLKSAQVKSIFDSHKPALIDLVTRIEARANRVDDSCVHQHFDIDKQRAFGTEVVRTFGYDFSRGRLDTTVHPFASFISRYDARITTRWDENFLNMALFGMMHESGHAIHCQGFAEAIDGTPLANGRTGPLSMSVGESQSRSWENLVGRSRSFWIWAFPKLQAAFPGQFDDVSMETLYGAVNKVQPSLVRVEADEVTYNLHIMARFELELELINDRLQVADLPEAWNAKYEALLGVRPPNDSLGVMQDTHWGSGLFGYFPTYALGNLLGAQYYAQALADHPEIPDEIAKGQFDTLRHWQNEHIHAHGRKFTADELTKRVCGEGMQADSYVAYLREKFSEIYAL